MRAFPGTREKHTPNMRNASPVSSDPPVFSSVPFSFGQLMDHRVLSTDYPHPRSIAYEPEISKSSGLILKKDDGDLSALSDPL
jgi:hypothetical protein